MSDLEPHSLAGLKATLATIDEARKRHFTSKAAGPQRTAAQIAHEAEEIKLELREILCRPADSMDPQARARAQQLYNTLCAISGPPKSSGKSTRRLHVINNDRPEPPMAA